MTPEIDREFRSGLDDWFNLSNALLFEVASSGAEMKIDAYVQFGGRAAEAVAFYQEHLGPIVMRPMPFRGTPGCDMVPEAWQDKSCMLPWRSAIRS